MLLNENLIIGLLVVERLCTHQVVDDAKVYNFAWSPRFTWTTKQKAFYEYKVVPNNLKYKSTTWKVSQIFKVHILLVYTVEW